MNKTELPVAFSPPDELPVLVEERAVVLTKQLGKPWCMTTKGKIRQIDINHLTRMLRVEYARMRRRSSLRAQAEVRKQKEALANAAA
jgi:hypothetical protein